MMRILSLKECLVFWGLIIIFSQWFGHNESSCLEEERKALLQLKDFFRFDLIGYASLRSWPETGDSDCCTWEQVECDVTTGRVMDLRLNYIVYSPQRCLNASMFSPFEELVNLHLAQNSFTCCVEDGGFDKLAHLKKLEGLNLAENGFQNNILKSLGALTTLRSLNLSSNVITSNVSFDEFTKLKSLEVLDLSRNPYGGNISPSIGELSSLVALSLRQNNLTGILPGQELCKLRRLKELDISHNHLQGLIPPCMVNLTSLTLLDLSTNNFTGEVSFIFPPLKSLEHIRLGNNNFHGKISLTLLANLSSLKLLEVLNNGDLEVEEDEDDYSDWKNPNFQLEVLVLSGCQLNKRSSKAPQFLRYQTKLKVLDLSHNNLRGDFPTWVVENNSQLMILNLRNNSFGGPLRWGPDLNTSVFWMDLSENRFSGKLPEDVGTVFPRMSYLNLSTNHFEGVLPSSFSNMSGLSQLDLSENYFSGEIHDEVVSGCLGNLFELVLSSNGFRGEIFSDRFNMTGLSVLDLGDNMFSGPISSRGISRSDSLYYLDASHNHFSGDLESWITNLTNLRTLFIQGNTLNGHFPCEIPSMFLLDVSYNSLSGPIPACPFNLQCVRAQSNKLNGLIPETLLNSLTLHTLDMTDNALSGNLPPLIGAPNLRALLLGGNRLSGPLPNQLCALRELNMVDLSRNRFSGQIPKCINNITFGQPGLYNSIYDDVFSVWGSNDAEKGAVTYGNILVQEYDMTTTKHVNLFLVGMDFVTKKTVNSYKGDVVNYMSGLDLSCNNLGGEIPSELGEVRWIHALNLSHNQIIGQIPTSISGLTQLESLDLSYNNLSGSLPLGLVELTFLECFSVAYNNLSGSVPKVKDQFGTFEKNSYEGNPYLCGGQTGKNCSSRQNTGGGYGDDDDDRTAETTSEIWYEEVDMSAFWAAYIIFFLVVFVSSWRCLRFNENGWRLIWSQNNDIFPLSEGPQPGKKKIEKTKGKW